MFLGLKKQGFRKGDVYHMKKILTLSIIVLSLPLVACSNKEEVVKQEKLDTLEEGMTKVGIKELFGEPLEQEDNQWTYDLVREDRTIALHIIFNREELAGSTTG